MTNLRVTTTRLLKCLIPKVILAHILSLDGIKHFSVVSTSFKLSPKFKPSRQRTSLFPNLRDLDLIQNLNTSQWYGEATCMKLKVDRNVNIPLDRTTYVPHSLPGSTQ